MFSELIPKLTTKIQLTTQIAVGESLLLFAFKKALLSKFLNHILRSVYIFHFSCVFALRGEKNFSIYSEDDKERVLKRIIADMNLEADKYLNRLNGAEFVTDSVKKGVRKKQPAPPFITSSMQQEASRKLGFTSPTII